MAEHNVKINVKTNNGYDQLYPKSKSKIIDFDKSNSNLMSDDVESAIKEVNTKSNENKTNIGVLSSLDTDSKTNIVEAINEVNTKSNENKTNIGILSTLKTAIKTNIVEAINSLYDSTIGKTLKTLDEIMLATEEGYYADALAVKELNSNLKNTLNSTNVEYLDPRDVNTSFVASSVIFTKKYGKFVNLYGYVNIKSNLSGTSNSIFRVNSEAAAKIKTGERVWIPLSGAGAASYLFINYTDPTLVMADGLASGIHVFNVWYEII